MPVSSLLRLHEPTHRALQFPFHIVQHDSLCIFAKVFRPHGLPLWRTPGMCNTQVIAQGLESS